MLLKSYVQKIGTVQIEKLPVDNFVAYFDVSGHTEDKGLNSVSISSVIDGTATPASVASIESFANNLIGVRFNGGTLETTYKCTLIFDTLTPTDTYHLEIILKVIPWRGNSQQLEKQPGESFVYGFEYADLLGGSDDGSGNLITTLSVQSVRHSDDSPATVIFPAGVQGSIGKVRVSGGISGELYRCTIIATGNNPTRTYGEVFFLNVVDL